MRSCSRSSFGSMYSPSRNAWYRRPFSYLYSRTDDVMDVLLVEVSPPKAESASLESTSSFGCEEVSPVLDRGQREHSHRSGVALLG
jgi:hypothetical protein